VCGLFICPRTRTTIRPPWTLPFEAVLAAGETESGVSVHLVDGEYDTGAIVNQCGVPVCRGDSLEDLKARVHAREKEFVVETLGQIAGGEIRLVAGAD
jgi:phosphoribosylglycinamide formyltransferase-1